MHRLATVHARDNQPTNDQRCHDTAYLNETTHTHKLLNYAISNDLELPPNLDVKVTTLFMNNVVTLTSTPIENGRR